VGIQTPRQSLVSFPPSRAGRDGTSEGDRSKVVDSSKLDITVDLELNDIQTTSMARAKSPSPLPPTMFDGHQVDTGV
jgi:hypothetical protein